MFWFVFFDGECFVSIIFVFVVFVFSVWFFCCFVIVGEFR